MSQMAIKSKGSRSEILICALRRHRQDVGRILGLDIIAILLALKQKHDIGRARHGEVL
jgi:hypothetical protein